jgi:succinoglycan biosynthesis transport protein ExoP
VRHEAGYEEDMGKRAGAVHLHDYLRVVQRRRWPALAVFTVIVGLVVTATFLQTPTFRGTALVMIDPEPRANNLQDMVSADTRTDYHPTQWEMIKARPVVERVIETLRLKQRMPEIGGAADPVDAFLGFLTVEPRRNTRLVAVHFDHASAALAAEVATGVAGAYARFNLDQKLAASREIIAWLSEQLGQLKAQVHSSASALQKYRSQAGVLGSQEQRQITASKIMDFNRAYLEAQSHRMAVEAKLHELARVAQDKDRALTMFTVADSPLLQKLRADAAALLAERSKLLKVYKDKHPEVVKVDAQLREGQERFEAELQTLVRAVETEFRVARAREQTLLANVEALKREAQALNEKEIQHLALAHDSESNRSLYDLVQKRLKETDVSTGIESNNVRVVQEAGVPVKPHRPRKVLQVAFGLLAGAVAGLGAAFFLDYLDRSIKTPADVERYLGVPVVGIVPAFAKRR